LGGDACVADERPGCPGFEEKGSAVLVLFLVDERATSEREDVFGVGCQSLRKKLCGLVIGVCEFDVVRTLDDFVVEVKCIAWERSQVFLFGCAECLGATKEQEVLLAIALFGGDDRVEEACCDGRSGFHIDALFFFAKAFQDDILHSGGGDRTFVITSGSAQESKCFVVFVPKCLVSKAPFFAGKFSCERLCCAVDKELVGRDPLVFVASEASCHDKHIF
jgi:hypothetical protein